MQRQLACEPRPAFLARLRRRSRHHRRYSDKEYWRRMAAYYSDGGDDLVFKILLALGFLFLLWVAFAATFGGFDGPKDPTFVLDPPGMHH